MPVFEIKCEDCGKAMEILSTTAKDIERECSKCGGIMKRQFGIAGIIFKGEGFYSTSQKGKNK